jgi:hypothetical protein
MELADPISFVRGRRPGVLTTIRSSGRPQLSDIVTHGHRWSHLGALPVGARPFRSVVGFTGAQVGEVKGVAWNEQKDFTTRMGFGGRLERKD